MGSVVPALLREGLAEGFHRFKRSRDLDPDGFADYSLCSKANMLYDRIALASRELVDVAKADIPELGWKAGRNKRATDIMLDPYFVFRIKREKQNRGGLTTSVDTWRQLQMKSLSVPPMLQMSLDFGVPIRLPNENRIWITIPFDLDELEESISHVSMGIELRTKFLWKVPLPEAEADIIASLPNAVADRISEMRSRRSA